MKAPQLTTERLLLRQWRADDLPHFAALNQDPEVMRHFPGLLSVEESQRLAENIQNELQSKPYGLWAVEVKAGAPFIGFVGLHAADFPASFTPCIEIGWRLASAHWGKGFAYEAALRVLDYAFADLKLSELVSFTAVENLRSQKLMKKLGMRHDAGGDFEHPKLPPGHRLRPHVLYRLSSAEFQQRIRVEI